MSCCRLPCLQSAVYSVSELKANSENDHMSTILEMNNYLTGFNLADVTWDLQWVFAVDGGVGQATGDSNPALCFLLCKPGVLVPVYVLSEVRVVTALVLWWVFSCAYAVTHQQKPLFIP